MARQKKPKTFDCVVVGGGPAGRIAALNLAHHGLDTALIAEAAPSPDGRTTALWQKSIDLLRETGIWPEIECDAAPLKKMRMIDDTRRLVRAPEVMFDGLEIGEDCFGFNIINDNLNKVLEKNCATVDTLTCFETFAETVTFNDEDVSVTTKEGQVVTARLAVAADGRNSLLRETAGIPVKRWSYPQVALVLNVGHVLPHHSISTEFHTPTGPYTAVPLPGNQSSIVAVETAEEAERLKNLPAEELERVLELRFHSVLGAFKLASAPKTFPLSGLTAEKFYGPRLALVGETAHVFPPIGAQGLNLSMRDVGDLCAIVKGAKQRNQDVGSAELLQHFGKKRAGDIHSRTNAVDLLNRSLLTEFLPVQMARSTGMFLAGKVTPFRKFLMREGMAPGTGFLPFR